MRDVGKNRQIGRLRPKFPMQRISEFFASDQGFCKREQRICCSREISGGPVTDAIDGGPPRMPGYGKAPAVATRLNLKNRSANL